MSKRMNPRALNPLNGAALLLATFAVVDTVRAAEFYVDAGVMESESKTEGFFPQIGYDSIDRGSGNERSVGWKVAGGYRITQHLALEAGFADFGRKKADDRLVQFSNSFGTYAVDPRIQVKGPYAALVGSLPINRWNPFAKIGVLRADTSTSTLLATYGHFGNPDSNSFYSESAKSTEALVGLGVTYALADHYGVTLEALYVPDAGAADRTGEENLTALSLNFQYQF